MGSQLEDRRRLDGVLHDFNIDPGLAEELSETFCDELNQYTKGGTTSGQANGGAQGEYVKSKEVRCIWTQQDSGSSS